MAKGYGRPPMGRKGGSNLAATLVNAVLCFNDAGQLRPGRDV